MTLICPTCFSAPCKPGARCCPGCQVGRDAVAQRAQVAALTVPEPPAALKIGYTKGI